MSGFVSFLEDARAATPEAAGQPIPAPSPPFKAAAAAVEPKPARQGRIRKALQAEDGHSLAEEAVYEALWKAGTPAGDPANPNGPVNGDRTIRIGYHRLAQLTRLSWVTVKANLRSLEKKLALEVTGSEDSATRQGKCYLVYSRPSILERRKAAGLEWVRRSRGVELFSQDAIDGAVRGLRRV